MAEFESWNGGYTTSWNGGYTTSAGPAADTKPLPASKAEALAEISAIERGAEWNSTIIRRRAELYKIAYAEPAVTNQKPEQAPASNPPDTYETSADAEPPGQAEEQEPSPERQPHDEISPAEVDRIIAEAEEAKTYADNYLRDKHGPQYETVARNAGELWSFQKSDARNALVNERLEAALGNDPEFLGLLHQSRRLFGDLSKPVDINLDGMSDAEKLGLAQKAIGFLAGGQILNPRFMRIAQKASVALQGVPETEQIDYFARLGQRLFNPNTVIDNTKGEF